jgi:hypothetical protein
VTGTVPGVADTAYVVGDTSGITIGPFTDSITLNGATGSAVIATLGLGGIGSVITPIAQSIGVQGVSLTVTGNVLDSFSIVLPSGAVTAQGGGALDLAQGGTLVIDGLVAPLDTIYFDDSAGNVLRLGAVPLANPNTSVCGLWDFSPGNAIDLPGVPYTPSLTAAITPTPRLVLSNSGITVATFGMGGPLTPLPGPVSVIDDGTGHAEILAEIVPCFAAGTHIATEQCAVAVEELNIGDHALTISGRTRTIQWIGYRHVDCARHPDPERVWPVCIAPHAFGEGRPRRMLLLSPDHSVFVEDVLIPIKFLVNDLTIVQLKTDSVTYYHVELERHDILLAEDLPVESYLETGGRSAFSNAGQVTVLYPDFGPPNEARVAAIWQTSGCAPLLGDGGQLDRARLKLRLQATMLGAAGDRSKQTTEAHISRPRVRARGRR